MTYRPAQKISVTGEVEGSSSSGAYFRTSLYDYQKVRAQVRYQAAAIAQYRGAILRCLNNNNPVPGVNYDYPSQQESLSLYWTPAAARFGDLQGSYSRSDLRSDIGYLDPQTLTPQVSLYRDNAHTATALFDLAWPHGKVLRQS